LINGHVQPQIGPSQSAPGAGEQAENRSLRHQQGRRSQSEIVARPLAAPVDVRRSGSLIDEREAADLRKRRASLQEGPSLIAHFSSAGRGGTHRMLSSNEAENIQAARIRKDLARIEEKRQQRERTPCHPVEKAYTGEIPVDLQWELEEVGNQLNLNGTYFWDGRYGIKGLINEIAAKGFSEEDVRTIALLLSREAEAVLNGTLFSSEYVDNELYKTLGPQNKELVERIKWTLSQHPEDLHTKSEAYLHHWLMAGLALTQIKGALEVAIPANYAYKTNDTVSNVFNAGAAAWGVYNVWQFCSHVVKVQDAMAIPGKGEQDSWSKKFGAGLSKSVEMLKSSNKPKRETDSGYKWIVAGHMSWTHGVVNIVRTVLTHVWNTPGYFKSAAADIAQGHMPSVPAKFWVVNNDHYERAIKVSAWSGKTVDAKHLNSLLEAGNIKTFREGAHFILKTNPNGLTRNELASLESSIEKIQVLPLPSSSSLWPFKGTADTEDACQKLIQSDLEALNQELGGIRMNALWKWLDGKESELGARIDTALNRLKPRIEDLINEEKTKSTSIGEKTFESAVDEWKKDLRAAIEHCRKHDAKRIVIDNLKYIEEKGITEASHLGEFGERASCKDGYWRSCTGPAFPFFFNIFTIVPSVIDSFAKATEKIGPIVIINKIRGKPSKGPSESRISKFHDVMHVPLMGASVDRGVAKAVGIFNKNLVLEAPNEFLPVSAHPRNTHSAQTLTTNLWRTMGVSVPVAFVIGDILDVALTSKMTPEKAKFWRGIITATLVFPLGSGIDLRMGQFNCDAGRVGLATALTRHDFDERHQYTMSNAASNFSSFFKTNANAFIKEFWLIEIRKMSVKIPGVETKKEIPYPAIISMGISKKGIPYITPMPALKPITGLVKTGAHHMGLLSPAWFKLSVNLVASSFIAQRLKINAETMEKADKFNPTARRYLTVSPNWSLSLIPSVWRWIYDIGVEATKPRRLTPACYIDIVKNIPSSLLKAKNDFMEGWRGDIQPIAIDAELNAGLLNTEEPASGSHVTSVEKIDLRGQDLTDHRVVTVGEKDYVELEGKWVPAMTGRGEEV
jgi:hypothetical protein